MKRSRRREEAKKLVFSERFKEAKREEGRNKRSAVLIP
jgi:hypothetical protein